MTSTKNSKELESNIDEGEFKKLNKLQNIQEEEDEESIVIGLKFAKEKVESDGKIKEEVSTGTATATETATAKTTPRSSFLSIQPRRCEISLGANFYEADTTSNYKIKIDPGTEAKEEEFSQESSPERMYLLSESTLKLESAPTSRNVSKDPLKLEMDETPSNEE